MTNKLESGRFEPAPVALLITLALAGVSPSLHARDYFNPAFLSVDNPEMAGTDLSNFEEGAQAPGKYRVDIIVNNDMVETREIDFRLSGHLDENGADTLQPCLTIDMLEGWGVKTALFPQLARGGECVDLSAIPMASAKFDFYSQRLLLSIPLAAINQQVRDYVPPEQWDEGINALLLNYTVSGANNWARKTNGENTNNQYVNLRPGLNIGPWRIRNYSTWMRDGSGGDKWDNVYTYIQRSIIPLKSQLTLGDSTSPSDIFDSVPFRGAQLASDDEMLPQSQRGYAPVVRGIARTNAQVVIRQNGYVIYQSYVPAGAFEINDLYSTGGSGDLNVTIKESDGSEQHLIVPFASIPVLQREGRLKYSITGGHYRSYDSSVEKTPFAQATVIYGLSRGMTLYGGIQESSRYQSLAFGIGQNLGRIGALSADVTQSWGTIYGQEKESGQSMRLRYGKNIVETGTNFAIAGYRYSTDGFYTMNEVLNSYGRNLSLIERRRNRAELTVSQRLGDTLGSLSASAVREDYWNTGKTMKSYGVSYSNSFKGVSYSLGYTYSLNSNAGANSASGATGRSIYDKDQIFTLNVNIPLSEFLPSTWAGYSLNTSKNGNTTNSISISGTALQNDALSWGIQEGYSSQGTGNTGSLNATYKGTYGELNTGYSYDRDTQRLNYGLSGGVVAHANGITLSQPLNETVALVKAPGAGGVSILNQAGAKTDFRGYAIVGNMSPYRRNDVILDTQTLPSDVEMELTTQVVTPTRGAVVRANYVTNVGMRVLMTLTRANGQAVPFGAMVDVSGAGAKQNFIVGDNGQVYLSGMEPEGTLNVQWGKGAGESCVVNYNLSSTEDVKSVITASAKCN